MIWRAPWVWLAALLVAVPIGIHLFSRRHARIVQFPTLRFVPASPLAPIRFTRLTDIALLAVRCCVVLAAVAALAQPVWRTEADRAAGRALARVVIVDTSATMRLGRVPQDGAAPPRSALDVARSDAARLAAEAGTATILETADPAAALATATAILRDHAGPAEIAIVTDFRAGGVGAAALASVPAHIGLLPHRVAVDTNVARTPEPLLPAAAHRASLVARVRATAAATSVEWTAAQQPSATAGAPVAPGAPGAPVAPVTLLVADADRARADAMLAAALAIVPAPPARPDRRVAIAFAGHATFAPVADALRAPDSPWMADLVARVHRDHLVSALETPPAVTATRDTVEGAEHLVLHAKVTPGSLEGTAIVAAALRGLAVSSPSGDPNAFATAIPGAPLTPEQVDAFRRPATPRAADAALAGAHSDGRWLWVVALAFLLVEGWLRFRADRALAARSAAP